MVTPSTYKYTAINGGPVVIVINYVKIYLKISTIYIKIKIKNCV